MYTFEATDGSTWVNISTQVRATAAFGLDEKMFEKQLKKQLKENLALLKGILETR